MWDAQVSLPLLAGLQEWFTDVKTALIAHQPALAAKYYATAALPPYCSSAACLALGNLLARGSGLAQPEEAHTPISPSETAPSSLHARSPQTSWFASIFRSSSPAVSPGVEKLSPRLITNGWSLPTDGKRAVRDVEGMGKAGGWLILGIGWLIDGEVQRSTSNRIPPRSQAISHSNDVESDEDMIVFDLKGKGRAGSRPFRQSPHQCIPAISNSSSTTEESFDLPTPEDDEDTCRHSWKTIKLLVSPMNIDCAKCSTISSLHSCTCTDMVTFNTTTLLLCRHSLHLNSHKFYGRRATTRRGATFGPLAPQWPQKCSSWMSLNLAPPIPRRYP